MVMGSLGGYHLNKAPFCCGTNNKSQIKKSPINCDGVGGGHLNKAHFCCGTHIKTQRERIPMVAIIKQTYYLLLNTIH